MTLADHTHKVKGMDTTKKMNRIVSAKLNFKKQRSTMPVSSPSLLSLQETQLAEFSETYTMLFESLIVVVKL